jgi:hypothetical protein
MLKIEVSLCAVCTVINAWLLGEGNNQSVAEGRGLTEVCYRQVPQQTLFFF